MKQAIFQSKQTHIAVAFVVLLLVAIYPIFGIQTLPLYDYPNHLARSYIIANLDDSAILQQFYTVRWAAIPNLAMDIIVPPLSTLMDVELAGKIFIVLTFLLLAGGVVLLHYALHRRLSAYPLLAFLFLYNGSFLFGFMNFLFGVGAYLVAFSLWILAAERNNIQRLVIFSVFSNVLFFMHLYGLGLYALSVFGYELSRTYVARKAGQRVSFTNWSVTTGQFLIPAAIFLMASPTSEEIRRTSFADLVDIWFYWKKPSNFLDLVDNYVPRLDEFTLIALALALVLGLVTRRITLHAYLVMPLFLLFTAFAFMPEVVLSSWRTDVRMVLPLTLTAIAATDWRVRSAAVRGGICAAVGALFLVRMAVIMQAWEGYDTVAREYRAAFAKLPEGARLTAAFAYHGDNMKMHRANLNHLGNFVVIDRNGLYSSIYTDPAQTLLSLNFDRKYAQVSFRDNQLTREFMSEWRDPFGPDFQRHYDYLLVKGEEEFETPIPNNLTPVGAGTGFRIFRIERPGRVDGGLSN